MPSASPRALPKKIAETTSLKLEGFLMKRTLLHASVAVLALALAGTPAFAKDVKEKKADKGVAVVNGKSIPTNRADALMIAQLNQGQPDTEDLRRAVREELVRREVLAQEAQKKGLDKKAEVQAQMELARQGVLIGAYLNDYVKTHPVTEDQIKKEYEDIKAKLGNKEYKARHILVEKEDEAKAIIARLKKGEKIEDLAKDSKDPGSRERGGDLGWANPASFVPPFSAAMTKLEKGKFTETPVKSDFGWHVIQLEDTRELKLPGIDEAKGQISQQLTQRMVQKHIDDLRAKAKVE
jgi:peptidyl-prolyl cis-trans isomerase C